MAKELLFLTGYLVSTSVVSFFLSLSLAIRSLFSSSESSSVQDSEEEDPASAVRLYEGRVWHVRRLPVHHSFDYPVRYVLIDLDRCSSPSSPFSFHSHSLSASEARRAADSNGPVLLLTIPKSAGYEQNPLSIYYCFHRPDYQSGGGGGGRGESGDLFLKACIAEVTNTPWGERVNFVFSPRKDEVAKPLHVSPFMDMMGSWKIHAEMPGEKLHIMISVQHPTLGNYFTATLSAKRVSCSISPTAVASYFWLMPHKVAVWIYWHALKLWWKGVSFVNHPKYLYPTYREDALVRDRELRCSHSLSQNENKHHERGGSYSTNADNKCIENRWCIWRDAPWPWS